MSFELDQEEAEQCYRERAKLIELLAMVLEFYSDRRRERATLARLEWLISTLTERIEKMASDLATEVQETRDAVTALSGAVTVAVEGINALIATVADLKAQLEAGGLTPDQEAELAAALDGVQTDLGTLGGQLVAAIPAPPAP